MPTTPSKNLFFKVNAEVKSIIGKDLINNDNIAVLELVKNAYDAGSPHVTIRFEGTQQPRHEASIVIEDQGHGMNLEDLKTKWLNIAYSEKKIDRIKAGRRVAGNKGVGRFSCDRLGKALDMFTRTKDGDIIHLSINWEDFEGVEQDEEVNKIPVKYQIVTANTVKNETGFRDLPSGTIIKISNLRSTWTDNKLLSLRRELERFANPHQDVQLDAFAINLICPEYIKYDAEKVRSQKGHEQINGLITNTIIDDLSNQTSSIDSFIDSSGESITTTLYHRGQRLFTLMEKNTFPALRKIRIKVLFLSPTDKALFTRRMGYQSIQFGSIFLFLHGFRISPYGELNNDWLAIDAKKQQKYASYLGTRDIIGRIEIDDTDSESSRWRIISNREGLVQTPAYHELTESKGYFYRVFRKLQRYVVEGVKWDSVEEKPSELDKKILKAGSVEAADVNFLETEEQKETNLLGMLKGIITIGGTRLKNVQLIEFDPSLAAILKKQKEESIKAFFDDFEQLAGKSATSKNIGENLSKLRTMIVDERKLAEELQKERDQAQEVADRYQKQAEEAEKKAEEAQKAVKKAERKAKKTEEENLFLKASSSQDIDDVVNMHHQVLTWANSINKDCARVLKQLAKEDQTSSSKKVLKAIERISIQNKRVLKTARFATKKNLKLNAEFREGDLLGFTRNYLSELDKWRFFRNINIEFGIPKDKSFIIDYKPLEVSIFIDNLLANAQKAGAQSFYVKYIPSNDDSMMLKFDDDGHGLDESIDDHKRIFDRGFTTTSGSGIGLNHCADIAKEMKGSLELSKSDHNGFALTLTIKQPKR